MLLSGSTAWRAVVPLETGFFAKSGSGRDFGVEMDDFGVEMDDFGVKIDEISWMKDGETWGDARSTRNQANPWIKINKTSSNQQFTKKNWGYFWWGFSNLGRNQAKEG